MHKKIKVTVIGMLKRMEDKLAFYEVKEVLKAVPEVEVHSLKAEVEYLLEHQDDEHDTGELVDTIFNLSIEAIDKADVFLVILPFGMNVREHMDKDAEYHHKTIAFVEWASFLKGYAWSQGKPFICYTHEGQEIHLSPTMARAVHATIQSPEGLKGYDWSNIPMGYQGSSVIWDRESC